MLRQTVSEKTSVLALPVLLSTLGTTEACAQALRKDLEEHDKEVIMFHTNGSGGKAMEEMIAQDKIAAVIDLSLHEIGDHLFGGDYDAGPTRGTAALECGIPTILVPGNIDSLVTGPFELARKQYPGRPYHVHNAAITVVRTGQKEIEVIAKRVADLCDNARGPVAVRVPMKGLSAFDSPDGPLHDPAGPEIFAAVFKANARIKSCLKPSPHHINDPQFTATLFEAVTQLLEDR
jgi:uncharacterized protein (UPF0261 family)